MATGACAFESRLLSLTSEGRSLLVTFVKQMLTRMPEDRATAAELVENSWLKSQWQMGGTGTGAPLRHDLSSKPSSLSYGITIMR